MTVNIMRASKEWASRPPEERFETIDEMLTMAEASKARAFVSQASPIAGFRAFATVYGDLMVAPGRGNHVRLNHHSFGQFSALAKAPAGYLRGLPASLAAMCLNEGLLKSKSVVSLLVDKNGKALTARAVTSDKYSRVWNADIIRQLMPVFKDGGWITPRARPLGIPGERVRPATAADVFPCSNVREGDFIAPAGLYCSDIDMFVLGVHPEREITSGLFRFFMLGNSEVGTMKLRFLGGVLDSVCGNHILWNCQNIVEFSAVHRGKHIFAMHRNLERQVQEYSNSSVQEEVRLFQRAKRVLVGDTKEEVITKLLSMNVLSSKSIGEKLFDTIELHPEDRRGADSVSVWSVVQGITRMSQEQAYIYDRTELDRGAAKMFKLIN